MKINGTYGLHPKAAYILFGELVERFHPLAFYWHENVICIIQPPKNRMGRARFLQIQKAIHDFVQGFVLGFNTGQKNK